MRYLQFYLIQMLAIVFTVAVFAGGVWLWTGIALGVFVAVGLDLVAGQESRVFDGKPFFYNLALYVNLPILFLLSFAFAWQLSPADLFGFGAWLQQSFTLDILSRKELTTSLDLFGGWLGMGLYYAACGTVPAHELVHRTWNKFDLTIGRWLLGFSFDTSFAIEHVYGHHSTVCTAVDPATARRGETVWRFFVRSSVGQFLSATRFEFKRLRRKGCSLISFQNRILTGNAISVCYLCFFTYAAGYVGALVFLSLALYTKAYLEFVNYLEHYGLVRVPGKQIKPHHSWNSNHKMSTYLMFNLNRHSHHHANGRLAYWDLQPMPDAPMLPFGYLTLIFIAGFPPLWNKVMEPKLKEWDEKFATEEELELLFGSKGNITSSYEPA